MAKAETISVSENQKALQERGYPEPPDEEDDRDAGIPVQVRRGPPDRSSSVAVAEPDHDEQPDSG